MGRGKRGQGTISAEEASWTSIFRGGARLGGTNQAASAVGMVHRVYSPLTSELSPPFIMPNGVSSGTRGERAKIETRPPGSPYHLTAPDKACSPSPRVCGPRPGRLFKPPTTPHAAPTSPRPQNRSLFEHRSTNPKRTTHNSHSIRDSGPVSHPSHSPLPQRGKYM